MIPHSMMKQKSSKRACKKSQSSEKVTLFPRLVWLVCCGWLCGPSISILSIIYTLELFHHAVIYRTIFVKNLYLFKYKIEIESTRNYFASFPAITFILRITRCVRFKLQIESSAYANACGVYPKWKEFKQSKRHMKEFKTVKVKNVLIISRRRRWWWQWITSHRFKPKASSLKVFPHVVTNF